MQRKKTYGFDPVTDSHNELTFFPHRIDEIHGNQTRIVGFGKLSRSTVQSTAESVTLLQKLHCVIIIFPDPEFQKGRKKKKGNERLTIVNNPETKLETRSFPALAQTIVL